MITQAALTKLKKLDEYKWLNECGSESAKRYLKAADELWSFIEKVQEEDLAGNEMIQPIYGVNGTPSACSMK